MLLWVFQYLHCKHLFMEGLGQSKLRYLGGVLRGMTPNQAHLWKGSSHAHNNYIVIFCKGFWWCFFSLLLSPTYHIFQVVSSIDQIFFRSLNVWGKHFNRSNNAIKPLIKTSIFEIFYENINLYLLLSPTYHIFKVVSSIDQIFFRSLNVRGKNFNRSNNATKPLIKTSIFAIIYENINLYNIRFIHQTYDSYSYLPIE